MHRDTFPSPLDPNPNKFPEHEHLKCPRCDSNNTKFCYYNNYNLSQPRHFCKNCRRYWTKGGTLRNIPIGGGTRKITKRPSFACKRASADTPAVVPVPVPSFNNNNIKAEPEPEQLDNNNNINNNNNNDINSNSNGNRINNIMNNSSEVESGGYSMGPFGNLLMEGLNFSLVSKCDEDVLIRDPIGEQFRSNLLKLNGNDDDNNNNNNNDDDKSGGGEERGETSCWNGWPDLSIFTPGSSFR